MATIARFTADNSRPPGLVLASDVLVRRRGSVRGHRGRTRGDRRSGLVRALRDSTDAAGASRTGPAASVRPTVVCIKQNRSEQAFATLGRKSGRTIVGVLAERVDVRRLDDAGAALDDARGLLEVAGGVFVAGEVRAGTRTEGVGCGVGHLSFEQW